MATTGTPNGELSTPPTLPADPEVRAHDRLGGGRAEEDDRARPDRLDLGFQPRPARAHLGGGRLLVQAPLAAADPAEVFDGVRDVDAGAVDPGLTERLVEQPAGRADERFAAQVLLVARLLAHEHDPRMPVALPENGLRRVLPQVAAVARSRGFAELLDAAGVGRSGHVEVTRARLESALNGHKRSVAKGDFVEVLVDAGSGAAREYRVEATKAGRSVEVRSSRTIVEVRELTRTGGVVRTARFIAPRVLAVVEHPTDRAA